MSGSNPNTRRTEGADLLPCAAVIRQDPAALRIHKIRDGVRREINLLESGTDLLVQFTPAGDEEDFHASSFEVNTDNAVLLAHALLSRVRKIRAEVDRLVAAATDAEEPQREQLS